MTKRQLKLAEKRVEQAYYKGCSGVEINIMDIGKVFKAGVAAIEADPTISDAALRDSVVAFVETIRQS